MRIATLGFVTSLLITLPTGCAPQKQYSQTELTTLQSREFDAPLEDMYAAAVNALFDAGYVIRSSDRDAGFIAAYRTHGSAWTAYSVSGVQVKVGQTGRRSSVRISTTDGRGQQQVDKEQIDELLNLIDRRLTGSLSSPDEPAGVPGKPLKGGSQ